MNKIELLQQKMTSMGVDATIIPSTDAHGSEYVASYWQAREYFSEFTGSAGTLVVTSNRAALWTDSRYFIQASEQLPPNIELMKMGLPQTPSVNDWLLSELGDGSTITIDSTLFSINEYKRLETELKEKNIIITTEYDFVSEIWQNRPILPQNKIFEFKKSGKNISDKLLWIRGVLDSQKIDSFVFTALDDIAWLLNIRGCDIQFNPVVISYLYVSKDEILLYIDEKKLDKSVCNYFANNGVKIVPYENFFEDLLKISNKHIGVDFGIANYKILECLDKNILRNIPSPVVVAKSVKNETELKGFRRAMIKDGVALVKFFMWLEDTLRSGHTTELEASEMLHNFRSKQEGFVSDSFETISAYGANGAIVHYEPTEDTNATLLPEGLFLLDSGGQYLDGTTDITRTVALGELTPTQKRDFTLVLKGHIALSEAIFPAGTRGAQLDVLARQFLWQDAKNFGHGTGHGVGHFLCVHEGPQSIRMQENSQVLLKGMVTSNEPAVYRAGEYGIRHENLIAVRSHSNNDDFGEFLSFEILTLCPFDKKGLDYSLLNSKEVEWINSYHKMCYELISPYLNNEEINWLKSKTSEISL